jgi:hypothetical protein
MDLSSLGLLHMPGSVMAAICRSTVLRNRGSSAMKQSAKCRREKQPQYSKASTALPARHAWRAGKAVDGRALGIVLVKVLAALL